MNERQFEPGDLMEWQEMTKAIKELQRQVKLVAEASLGIVHKVEPMEHRLDDLEQAVGDLMGYAEDDQFIPTKEEQRGHRSSQTGT